MWMVLGLQGSQVICFPSWSLEIISWIWDQCVKDRLLFLLLRRKPSIQSICIRIHFRISSWVCHCFRITNTSEKLNLLIINRYLHQIWWKKQILKKTFKSFPHSHAGLNISYWCLLWADAPDPAAHSNAQERTWAVTSVRRSFAARQQLACTHGCGKHSTSRTSLSLSPLQSQDEPHLIHTTSYFCRERLK